MIGLGNPRSAFQKIMQERQNIPMRETGWGEGRRLFEFAARSRPKLSPIRDVPALFLPLLGLNLVSHYLPTARAMFSAGILFENCPKTGGERSWSL